MLVGNQPTGSKVCEDDLKSQLREKDIEENRVLRLYSKGKVSETRLDAMCAEIRKERESIERQIALSQEEEEMRQRARRATVSFEGFASGIDNLSFPKRREILKTFIDGTPGTGVFVEKSGSLKIVGAVPVPADYLPGSVPNSSML